MAKEILAVEAGLDPAVLAIGAGLAGLALLLSGGGTLGPGPAPAYGWMVQGVAGNGSVPLGNQLQVIISQISLPHDTVEVWVYKVNDPTNLSDDNLKVGEGMEPITIPFVVDPGIFTAAYIRIILQLRLRGLVVAQGDWRHAGYDLHLISNPILVV